MAESSSRIAAPLQASAAAGWQRANARAGRATKRLCDTIVYVGLLALFGVSCVAWTAISLALLILPRSIGQPAGQILIMAGFRYFLAVMRAAGALKNDLSSLDRLRGRTPLIIAPNHPSQIDVMLIASRLPHVVCGAKSKLLTHPLLGAMARLAGYIPNDAPHHFVREAVRQLHRGRQLLIFPEGTRSTGTGIGPFKQGFALIAQCAEAPIQTVFIESNSRFLAKGWPWLRVPEFPLVYRVRLGPVLSCGADRCDFVAGMEKAYDGEVGVSDR
ncbi:MAG TPA: lysophospholipid acyltransferase family protein [Stellaceae bacterium]|jgi:1-acyl-sn-glycerol-3-phosphate acyltransferase|nr:lysophospholipid acyltransferase family protein [Stellaceae bacterium]